MASSISSPQTCTLLPILSAEILATFCSFFFFSSRRRHTRSDRDWSSDVCSSDLFETRHRSGLFTGLTDNYIRVGVPADDDLSNQIRLVCLTGATDGLAVGALTPACSTTVTGA